MNKVTAKTIAMVNYILNNHNIIQQEINTKKKTFT